MHYKKTPLLNQQELIKRKSNIQIYKKLLSGKSEKEINDYFGNLPDSKVIVADESGGFTTSSTND